MIGAGLVEERGCQRLVVEAAYADPQPVALPRQRADRDAPASYGSYSRATNCNLGYATSIALTPNV